MTTAALKETETLPQCDLHCTLGSSNKVYHAIVEPQGDGFIVRFAYGAKNSTLTRGTKTNAPVTLDEALSIYTKLVNEKVRKGYKSSPGVSGKVFLSSSSLNGQVSAISVLVIEKEHTGLYPQLLNFITEEEVEDYIRNPRYGAQEKKDGRRLLTNSDGKNVRGVNKQGFAVEVSPAIAESAMRLGKVLLDGEAIGDTLHVFGLLEHNGEDLRSLPYVTMHDRLSRLLGAFKAEDLGLKIVPLYTTEAEKRDLYERLKKEKKEGIVFKDLSAPHSPGRPSRGGPQVKFKFWSSATCIVLERNNGKRSVKLGVLAAPGSAEVVQVGNVTIPANYEIPDAQALCEIRYLYAYPGGSLFQPQYLGGRDDSDPDTVDTLKYVSKED